MCRAKDAWSLTHYFVIARIPPQILYILTIWPHSSRALWQPQESTRWWSNDVVGWSLGFRDSMDCCWSVQSEIDFGLSVGRHCRRRADQQQPISSARLWQLWSEWTSPNIAINVPWKHHCHSALTKKCQPERLAKQRSRGNVSKHTALLYPCWCVGWLNPDNTV